MIPEENDHEKDTHIHSTSLCARQCCEYSPRSVVSPMLCRQENVQHMTKKAKFCSLRMREKEAEHGRGRVEEKEEADSGLQNEGGGKKTQGFLPPTPPPPHRHCGNGKTMAFLRLCADKAALKKTNGRD